MSSSSASSQVATLVEQGIEKLRDKRDKAGAAELLAKAIRLNPNHELAWLWFSGVVETEPEQLYCLKRVLAINPENDAANNGLSILGPNTEPAAPTASQSQKSICNFPGCKESVSKAGHTLCHGHWTALNTALPSVSRRRSPASRLNATDIGEQFELSSHKANRVLAELGWIGKERKGWVPTPLGRTLGGVQKEFEQTGKPFVTWPSSILSNKVLLDTVQNIKGESQAQNSQDTNSPDAFRDRFPATHRTTDGHLVRSKAEMVIDNWLYFCGIAHAYERQLPIAEEMYCDFYLPEGKVYVEYWGLEKSAKYSARKKVKQELYQKYKFNLIELGDEEIKNLDDYLPKMLLKFGVEVS